MTGPRKYGAPKPRWGRPEVVRRALDKVLKGVSAKRGFNQIEILTRWPAIVGEMLAQHSCPERLTFDREKGGDATLLVRVDGAFGLELQHLTPQVIERVNTYFGYRALKRIQIVQGPVPRETRPVPRPRRALNDDELAQVAAAVAPTRDPELADALTALGRAVMTADPPKPAKPT